MAESVNKLVLKIKISEFNYVEYVCYTYVFVSLVTGQELKTSNEPYPCNPRTF